MIFFLISGLLIGFGLGIALHDRDCKKCLRDMNGRLSAKWERMCAKWLKELKK